MVSPSSSSLYSLLFLFLFTPGSCSLVLLPSSLPLFFSSVSYLSSSFLLLFGSLLFTATSDYTNYLSLPVSLRFYTSIVGHEVLLERNRKLLKWGSDFLTTKWGTSLYSTQVTSSPPSPLMTLVQLPQFPSPSKLVSPSGLASVGGNRTRALCESLRLTLRRKFNIEVMLVTTKDDGRVFARLSAQIYNSRKDYKLLGDAVEKLLKFDQQ
jgi:hypothetical protein